MPASGAVEHSIWEAGPQEVVQDALRRHRAASRGFRMAVAVTGVLFLVGIGGFALRLAGGFQDRAAWGYYATTFAYLLATVQTAPLVSMGLLLTKAHLQRSLSRPAVLFAAPGLLVFLMFLPLLALIPPVQGRNSIWFQWPVGAPYALDTLALGFLVLCGLVFLWANSWPDLAMLRRLARGRRAWLAGILAPHWLGTQRQWQVLKKAMVALGALYFVALVFNHTVLSIDLSMSLVPGWRSAIYGPYHIITSLLGGVAATIVAMALFRLAGFRSYLLLDHFWALGRLLLTFALLSIYFWWSEFIILWYGRTPQEQTLFQLIMTGPYQPVFLAGFTLSFLVPLLALLWNPVRQSILGPTLVACVVLVGLFLDRIRLYVMAFSAAQPGIHPIEQVPPPHLPDGADLMIMVGLPAGAIFLYLLASRLVPGMSVWEIQEGQLLRVARRYLRRETYSLGKPE